MFVGFNDIISIKTAYIDLHGYKLFLWFDSGVIKSNSMAHSMMSSQRCETALQLLQRRSSHRHSLSIGCPIIDDVLGGGFPCGGITEISGEAGCGKTQICLTLAMQCMLPESQGGLGGAVCYLSCGEGRFPVTRLSQLAQAYEPRCPGADLLSNVFIEECYTPEDALENIRKRIPQKCKSDNVRLLVIDSIAGIFRTEFDATKSDQRFQRTISLFRLATELKILADSYRLCVIVVNQVTAAGFDQPEHFGRVDPIPALGLVWSHCVNTRVILRRECRGFLATEDRNDDNVENVQNHSTASNAPMAIPSSADPLGIMNPVVRAPLSLVSEKPAAAGRIREIQGTRRYLTVEFSPLVPPGSCRYEILSRGVAGVGE